MNNNILGYEKITTLLRKFAVPSIVALIISSLYNIVDQIFIGQGVGYLANAATNVAFPLTSICLAIALLIGIGSAAGFSLKLGEGDTETAKEYVRNALGMIIVFGLIYFIAIRLFCRPMLYAFGATKQIISYAETYTKITAYGMPMLIAINAISNLARADGSPNYSMLCMIVGAIVNTILDPIFIFVFKAGIAGAAWATVIGQAFSLVLALLYIKKFKSVNLKNKFLSFNFKCWRKIASLGMSNSLNQIAICVVQIVLNNSLTHYGALSIYGEDIPLAGTGIVMKVNSILISVYVGLSQGSQPIIGFNYGAKQYDRVIKTYKTAVTTGMIIGLMGLILFQTVPDKIVAIFGGGSELYYEFSVKFMRTFLFMIPLTAAQMLSSNFFSAIGKPIIGAFLSLTRQVIFLIPLMLILPNYFGLDGILISGPIADGLACLVSVLTILFEFKKMNELKENVNGKI